MQTRRKGLWAGRGLGAGSRERAVWSTKWRSNKDLSNVFSILSLAKDLVSNLFSFTSFVALVKCCLLQIQGISSSFCCPGNSSPYLTIRVLLISLQSFNLSLKIKTSSKKSDFVRSPPWKTRTFINMHIYSVFFSNETNSHLFLFVLVSSMSNQI